jgi:hypothetical protein
VLETRGGSVNHAAVDDGFAWMLHPAALHQVPALELRDLESGGRNGAVQAILDLLDEHFASGGDGEGGVLPGYGRQQAPEIEVQGVPGIAAGAEEGHGV